MCVCRGRIDLGKCTPTPRSGASSGSGRPGAPRLPALAPDAPHRGPEGAATPDALLKRQRLRQGQNSPCDWMSFRRPRLDRGTATCTHRRRSPRVQSRPRGRTGKEPARAPLPDGPARVASAPGLGTFSDTVAVVDRDQDRDRAPMRIYVHYLFGLSFLMTDDAGSGTERRTQPRDVESAFAPASRMRLGIRVLRYLGLSE